MGKKKKAKERPRLAAKTTLEVADWLSRAADYETEKGLGKGALAVTKSDIIRRAVDRELLKIQEAGGPSLDP